MKVALQSWPAGDGGMSGRCGRRMGSVQAESAALMIQGLGLIALLGAVALPASAGRVTNIWDGEITEPQVP